MAHFHSNTQVFKYSLKLLVFVGFLIVSFSSYGQEPKLHTKSKKAEKSYLEAQKFYNLRYDQDAASALDEALVADSNFIEALLFRAQINLEYKKFDAAAVLLERVKELDSKKEFPEVYRMLGDVYLTDLKLNKALEAYETYKSQRGVSVIAQKRAADKIELIYFRKQLVDNPVIYKPVNLGANINSPYIEHSPTLTVDEQTIYFTRKEPEASVGGREFYDENLYVSTKDEEGNWTKAVALSSDINTSTNEGASAISPDGKYLFFTSCDRPDSKGGCDIYIATKKGKQWVRAKNLGAIINTRSWESQPSFGPDGRTLYFVRRVGRGKGMRKDIYMSMVQDNGQWTTPVPISINSNGNEESPFLHPDGQTFYFISDGYPGMGGRDLFMSRIDSNGNFGAPENLGYPINSPADEVSLVVSANGQRAYFASGMDGGYGQWDLYYFDLPKKLKPHVVNYTKGLVYNSKTKEPVGAKFEIIDLNSGDIVIESYSDKVNGEFLVTIPTGKDYAVNVSAKGYLFYSANYNLPDGDDTSKVSFDIPLSPIEKGVSIVLNNVFYEFNSFELKSSSKFELNKLANLLEENPQMKIEIGGHTDNKGSLEYNQKLSENRAKSVYNYLINQGIDASRLSYKGYNFSKPVETNDTAAGRAKNRRTEFTIL